MTKDEWRWFTTGVCCGTTLVILVTHIARLF